MKLFIISLLCIPALADIHPVSFPVPLALRAGPTSTDGFCGDSSSSKATCLTSIWGNCCSEKGFCGKTVQYCGEGCQSEFGTCLSSVPGAQIVSMSGSCGATSSANITCKGSERGDCCSALGYCGSTSDYCGNGCQSAFGTCGEGGIKAPTSSAPSSVSTSTSTSGPSSTSSSSSSSATSTSSVTPKPVEASSVSVDGNCGANSATFATCLTSEFGNCCSLQGYCGGNSSYCDAGCQSSYGTCGITSNATGSVKPAEDAPAEFLSTGAKAGIGLAAAALAVAAMGIIVWYVLRRRKSPRRGAVEMGPGYDADTGFQDKDNSILMQQTQPGTMGHNAMMAPLPSLGPQNRGNGSAPAVHELGDYEAVELETPYETKQKHYEMSSENPYERKEKEMNKDWVDDRARAGYDGAYRGN